VIDNDAIITRLFISALKRVVFDWFKSLDTWFLFRFYEDDIEVTVDKFLSTVQKGGEAVRNYIERFQNLSF